LDNTILFSPERKEGLRISSFIFLRVGGVQLSEGMKVIGGDRSANDSCKLMKIQPTSDLIYSVVGVLHPMEELLSNSQARNMLEFPQELLESNISGFVSILQMDFDNDKMSILSPCPGMLPSQFLLVGSIKWVE
jgi:polyribonucleotide 5'-hydroxyl-kinase